MLQGNNSVLFVFTLGLLALLLPVNKAAADWQWNNDSAAAPLKQGWYEACFTFTNSGTGVLSVTDLSFSCSCTVYKFISEKARPGQKASLVVRVQKDIQRHTAGTELNFYAFGQNNTTPKKLSMLLNEGESGK